MATAQPSVSPPHMHALNANAGRFDVMANSHVANAFLAELLSDVSMTSTAKE